MFKCRVRREAGGERTSDDVLEAYGADTGGRSVAGDVGHDHGGAAVGQVHDVPPVTGEYAFGWLQYSGDGESRDGHSVAGFKFGANSGNNGALLGESLARRGCFIKLQDELSAHGLCVDAGGFKFGRTTGIDGVVATLGCSRGAQLRA